MEHEKKGRLQRVKQHFKDNKKVYLVGVGGVFIGALAVGRGAQVVDGFKFIHLQYKSPNVYQVAMSRRGHPGYVITNNLTGEVAASIRRMAELDGRSPTFIRNNLGGENPLYSILGEAK